MKDWLPELAGVLLIAVLYGLAWWLLSSGL
jgi:hypothetical protein